MDQGAVLQDLENKYTTGGQVDLSNYYKTRHLFNGRCCQSFQANPKKTVSRCYNMYPMIFGSQDGVLLYKRDGHLQLKGFSYADWVSPLIKPRSTGSYSTSIGGKVVTWKSKRERTVDKYSYKPEYREMARIMTESLQLKSPTRDEISNTMAPKTIL